MTNPTRRSNSVAALRPRKRGRVSVFLQRLALAGLLIIGGTALLYVVLTEERQIRGWAAVVAVISLLGAAIVWLARASQTLSSSGRDPRDLSGPPGTAGHWQDRH